MHRQAADGTWQLWSCIRHTLCGGNTRLFYLFRNQLYGRNSLNTQYASANPLNFGVGNDPFRIGSLPVAAPEIFQDGDQRFIASLMPSLKGIRLAKLKWAPPDATPSAR